LHDLLSTVVDLPNYWNLSKNPGLAPTNQFLSTNVAGYDSNHVNQSYHYYQTHNGTDLVTYYSPDHRLHDAVDKVKKQDQYDYDNGNGHNNENTSEEL
jgi:hypothetical protein